MKTTPYIQPPEGGKELYDGVHAMIKLARWAYEKALEEGFTSAQSLSIAQTYLSGMMAIAMK